MMTSVLVVGAGPSGLALALGLATRGVPVRIVDRAAAGASWSRAAVVHPATLEALDAVGATRPLLDRALEVPDFWVREGGRTLARITFRDLPTRYPFAAMVPQPDTEAVLRERLGEHGVEVEWETSLVDLTQDTDCVRASLAGPDGPETAVAAYVVGADGGHSRTRELAGIGFPGARYEQSFVLADLTMDWPVPRTAVSLTFAVAGLLVVAPLPGGGYRVVATADADGSETPTADDVAGLLADRAPGARLHDLAHASRFRISHRLAERYRTGRVVVLGDAAHIHSPAGGQGMNTGIRDALALAELLATGADLDTYERTRRPVARGVLRLTDRMTRAATLRGRLPRAARDTAVRTLGRLPAVRRRLALQLAGLAAP